jgi:hypothetical protein
MDTSIFYMDEKYTLAAFFTTVTAFLTGCLSLSRALSLKKMSQKIIDIGHGLFFIILALDEYFEIHEYTNTVIKTSLKEEGMLKTLANFSWIFPLSLIIAAVFILLLIKIKTAGKEIRMPLILGSLSFLTVLIFELLGSGTYGQNVFLYFVAIEEGLEMIGVSFFLMAGLMEKKLSKMAPGLY